MIDALKLTKRDEDRLVDYQPTSDGNIRQGRIVSWKNGLIFVEFDNDGNPLWVDPHFLTFVS